MMTKESTSRNSIRVSINSWIFSMFDNFRHWIFSYHKKEFFKDHPYIVVELGLGTGENMSYYRKCTKLIALKPNINMHSKLQKKVDKFGINLSTRTSSVETIDLSRDSISLIVSTFTICSLENQNESITKIKDILMPRGKFVFIDHVKTNKKNLLL